MRTDHNLKKKGEKTKGVNYESHAPSLTCFQQQAFRKHCTKDHHMHIGVYSIVTKRLNSCVLRKQNQWMYKKKKEKKKRNRETERIWQKHGCYITKNKSGV